MVSKNEAKAAGTKSGKPAKGGKGKKAGKKNVSHRSALLLDGLPVSEMSREQLLNHLTRLLDQLEKEREERNFFQLERDQIYGFWKVAKEEVEDVRARLRNKEKDLDDAEEMRQKDIAVYKQQIKCLLHEHQSTLAESRNEQQSALELAHLDHQQQERILREEQLRLKEEIRQLSLKQQLTVDKIKLEHSQELSLLRRSLEQEARQLEIRFQNQTDTLRDELEKRRRNDLQDTDIKDQQHLAVLKKNHEQAIIDLKNYFNDIILNNMTLITSMKEQLAEYRLKEERVEKQFQSTNREVKRLRDKCDQLEGTNKDLQKDTENWLHAKTSLQVAKGHHKTLLKQLEEAEWQREVAEQRFTRIKNERDELEENFMAAILEVQQKANLKQLVLEKKLEALQETLQTKEITIKQLTSSASNSQRDGGTHSSGETISSSVREGRRQTVVKMNFEARNQEEPPDKSFQSSNESIAVEEKISVMSNSMKSALSSTKSSSAIFDAGRAGAVNLVSARRKLSSAN